MVQKDVKKDFQIHDSSGDVSRVALSTDEVLGNLRSAKKWRTIGIERALKTGSYRFCQ